MKKYYICKYDSNYADEFDLEGFSLFTEKEYKEYFNTIPKLDFYDKDIYFGTNECQNFSNVDELNNDLDWYELTKKEYKSVKNLLGKEYGTLTPRNILDNLFELPRRKK